LLTRLNKTELTTEVEMRVKHILQEVSRDKLTTFPTLSPFLVAVIPSSGDWVFMDRLIAFAVELNRYQ